MGTQKYIDSEKSSSWLDSFLTGQTVEEKQPIVEVIQEPEIDIDPDIEKEGVGKVMESVKFLSNSIIGDYLIL